VPRWRRRKRQGRIRKPVPFATDQVWSSVPFVHACVPATNRPALLRPTGSFAYARMPASRANPSSENAMCNSTISTSFFQTYAKLAIVNFAVGFLLRWGRFHPALAHRASAFPSTGRCGRTDRHIPQIDRRVHVAVIRRPTTWASPVPHVQAEGFQPIRTALT